MQIFIQVLVKRKETKLNKYLKGTILKISKRVTSVILKNSEKLVEGN
jgi:hypothetical protein